MGSIALVPEIDEMATETVENTVTHFQSVFEATSTLPGQTMQNMATWIVAWSIEMAWCWSEDILDECAFSQNMDDFQVPMDKFSLVPNDWVSQIVTAFMQWCYSNPGYTERHELDIYDPVRDGYLTIVRLVVTKMLASL
jgi:hypothetical protein